MNIGINLMEVFILSTINGGILMTEKTIKSNIMLLAAAAIWGFAFVAQSVGMQYLGPFTFNFLRFMLGSFSLIPLIIMNNRKRSLKIDSNNKKNMLIGGLLLGTVLFLASSFQQIGIIGTSVGKAAFITGLYVIIVPFLSVFLNQKLSLNAWLGAIFSIAGLYFISITDRFYMSTYDLLELGSALFYALHILLIDYFSNKIDAIKLAFYQYVTCSILSFFVSVFTEKIIIYEIFQAIIPILYAGICSVGIAYTLQIVGQKNAKPFYAAIILSMESVFATIGGFLILHENLTIKNILGCLLILFGMILSQIKNDVQKEGAEI